MPSRTHWFSRHPSACACKRCNDRRLRQIKSSPLSRKKRRLEMVSGLGQPLLFLVSGVIIGVVAFALLSDWTEEWSGGAESPPDIEATVTSRVELALASMPKPTPEVVVKEVVKEVIVEKAAGVASDSESVLAEDVFQDIFQNATQVDRISIDDIKNCQAESMYDVKLGDVVSVEVALARREDSESGRYQLRPYYSYIRDTGNHGERAWDDFSLTSRIIGNPWNEANTGPYVIAVYRGKTSGTFNPEESAIGDWIENWGSLVPGTYTVSFGFVRDHPHVSDCKQMQPKMDASNLIPDSVLIAWYVN